MGVSAMKGVSLGFLPFGYLNAEQKYFQLRIGLLRLPAEPGCSPLITGK